MKYSSSLLMLVASVVVASFSQVLLKQGARKQYSGRMRQYLNVWVLSGYGLMMLSTVLSLLAFYIGAEFKLSPVIEALGYVLVMVLSRVFFREPVTPRKLAGNMLILAGVAVFCL